MKISTTGAGLSVLIPWGDDGSSRRRGFAWLLERYDRLLPDAELVIGRSDTTPFNLSAARNHAFAQASHDLLLLADADAVFSVRQVLRGAREMARGARWVIPYGDRRFYYLSAAQTAKLLDGPPQIDLPLPGADARAAQAVCGLMLIPREGWERVGGFDERFAGWGREDDAFVLALETLWGPCTRLEEPAMHLWHEVAPETRYDSPCFAANSRLYAWYVEAAGNAEAMREVLEPVVGGRVAVHA